ncbi:MAG: hypothetical protein K0R39_1287, partial [Symbiobacteriaceae bacterium]|nr:hypothetical protein [Symbiobacteriaceae bacterium]
MRILVDPEHLQFLASRLHAKADEVRRVGDGLRWALQAVDWETRSAAGVDSYVEQARYSANRLADRLEDMAFFVVQRAQAFGEADAEGAAMLSGSVTTYLSTVPTGPLSDGTYLCARDINEHLSNGDLLNPPEQPSKFAWLKTAWHTVSTNNQVRGALITLGGAVAIVSVGLLLAS